MEMINTTLYKRLCSILSGIKSRCYNINNKQYLIYGFRGIEVCREWRMSSRSFYEWSIDNGYYEGLTIDRIDPNGNYEPSNCQWITRSTNSRKVKWDRDLKRLSMYSDRAEIDEWLYS